MWPFSDQRKPSPWLRPTFGGAYRLRRTSPDSPLVLQAGAFAITEAGTRYFWVDMETVTVSDEESERDRVTFRELQRRFDAGEVL